MTTPFYNQPEASQSGAGNPEPPRPAGRVAKARGGNCEAIRQLSELHSMRHHGEDQATASPASSHSEAANGVRRTHRQPADPIPGLSEVADARPGGCGGD